MITKISSSSKEVCTCYILDMDEVSALLSSAYKSQWLTCFLLTLEDANYRGILTPCRRPFTKDIKIGRK